MLTGLAALFAALGALALAVAAWVAVAVPSLPALPRGRRTVLDLARSLAAPEFLTPTIALAATTAALSVGVGFLPVLGTAAGLGPVAIGAVVGALALVSSLAQPPAGHAHDRGALSAPVALCAGFGSAAVGFVAAATLPGPAGLVPGAVAVGLGVGLVTPIAFATLAAGAPPERMGQTMGSAEVGRELGDAGGPLLVGASAAAGGVGFGLLGFAAALAVTGALTARRGCG